MLLRALGPLEIVDEHRAITPSAVKQRVVLALLLVNANRVVSTEALIEEIWDGKPPTSASNTLQTYIYQLRKLLGSLPGGAADVRASLVTVPGGYTLIVPDDAVDVAVFAKLVDRGSRAVENGDAAGGAELLSRALDMWRGEPLCGVALGKRLGSYVTSLHESRLRAIERHHDALFALGESSALVPGLKLLAEQYPDHEAFQRQLMLALARSGRRAEALHRFRVIRIRLAEELGLDPSRQLQQLHEAILTARPGVVEDADAYRTPKLPTPAQLLPGCAGYQGYADLLDNARAVLEPVPSGRPTPPVIRISGPPASGRSTFATHLAHSVKRHYPDGQLFQRLDRTGPSAALEGFLHAAGIPSERIPASESGRAALFRSWAADRRVLVVLHDVADAADLRPLLPAGPACASIVTCAGALPRMPGSHDVLLNGIDEDAAVELLRSYVGPERMSPEARTIARRCDNLPGLVVEIGCLLASHREWTLDYVVNLLREDSWSLWRLSGGQERLDERLHDTIDDLDEIEDSILRLLCVSDVPPTLPHLVRILSVSTLSTASAIGRLLRCGLAVERCEIGATHPDEPVYEVPRLVKHYMHQHSIGRPALHPVAELDRALSTPAVARSSL